VILGAMTTIPVPLTAVLMEIVPILITLLPVMMVMPVLPMTLVQEAAAQEQP